MRAIRHVPLLRALALVCLGGLLLLLAAAGLVSRDHVIGQIQVLSEQPVGLYRGQSLGQTFTAPDDGLYRIDLLFGTHRKVREGSVSFSLYSESGQLLVHQVIDSAQIRDSWFSIRFRPLSGIAGQTLRFELERPESSRSAVALWVGPGTSYSGAGIFKGEIDPSFDLAFRAYTTTPPTLSAHIERLREVGQALTWSRPGLFGQPSFLFFLCAVYSFSLALLPVAIIAITRRR